MNELGFINNFLYYHTANRPYVEIKKILKNLGIEYKEVKMSNNLITREFVGILAERCENGFDDLIKTNIQKDCDDLKYSEMVELIVKDYKEILKSAIFFGKMGRTGEKNPRYKVTSGTIEDEYTVHIPYEKREVSKIND